MALQARDGAHFASSFGCHGSQGITSCGISDAISSSKVRFIWLLIAKRKPLKAVVYFAWPTIAWMKLWFGATSHNFTVSVSHDAQFVRE